MLQRKLSFLAPILSSCLVGILVPLLDGQVVELHGLPGDPDSYSCVLSGLKGMGNDCGTKYDEMVFTAEILSTTPAPNDEFRLTLRPETIFKGTPTVGMEILTAQRKCLPAMKTGDSWLFSLYRDEKLKELVVDYGSRSGPETDKGSQIDFLRRLAGLDAAGVVKGRAYADRETKEGRLEQFPSVDHTIILTRVEDGRKFKALTNKKGEFEFGPVPAGKYDLDPNTKPGLWTMWSGGVDVEPHGCTDFDLDFQADGQIAGRLLFPEGVDPAKWQVEVTPTDDPGVVPASAWTDDAGGFVLHGLSPGKYIVALEKTEERDGPNLRVDLYAPGTPNRVNARIIELNKATRVEGIELVVPRSAVE
ncbi:MAG: carboxypeptidase-like regulatory domain-containing protein [Terracidiphilus sp.]|jgi:hypothetical protein